MNGSSVVIMFFNSVLLKKIKLFLTQCVEAVVEIVCNQLDQVLDGAFLLVFKEENSVCTVQMLFMSALITFVCTL